YYFFFQAEAGIRDFHVTGVQTCALPISELPDRRGRFDTIGRTVYFAERATTAFAEVLQDLRAARVTLQADADAIGMSVEEHITAVRDQAAANGRERPWAQCELADEPLPAPRGHARRGLVGPDRPQGHTQPPGPGPRRAAPAGRGPAAYPQRHHR